MGYLGAVTSSFVDKHQPGASFCSNPVESPDGATGAGADAVPSCVWWRVMSL